MELKNTLMQRIQNHDALIGVVGLGYVGLPLVMAFADKGFPVLGFDIDPEKCTSLKNGHSYIKHIATASIEHLRQSGRFDATSDMQRLGEPDVILICVPTPLNAHREPDLRYILATGRAIGKGLRPGQLICLESTTYPGTTDEDLKPVLEQESGLQAGKDFFLAFSPEREDPNNGHFTTATIPKVVGGLTPACLEVSKTLYDQVINQTVPVASTRVAEASKILENTFRAVNIALVNELKVLFTRMDIDVWEVIAAARTKPFGFMPFYPGPGLGGHCIPIDPFYLTWKAREYDYPTRFIELAGEINTAMPYFVLEQAGKVMNKAGKCLSGSSILILGVAYKKNIDDQRESPALKLIDLFRQEGAVVEYHDPHVDHCFGHRHYPQIDLHSTPLDPKQIARFDLVVLATDHDDVDYEMVANRAHLVLDTRNVFDKRGIYSSKIFKA